MEHFPFHLLFVDFGSISVVSPRFVKPVTSLEFIKLIESKPDNESCVVKEMASK